jgi:Icc-related predicted phosphoesterase
MTRLVLISDTHTYHDKLTIPDGDILIHAGDLTRRGALEDVEAFDAFLARLRHPVKIVIAGNHDFCFQERPREARSRIRNAIYLEDAGIEVAGLKIYGSPWQPWFYDWAFNLPRGKELADKWRLIPSGTDVVVTHGPPLGQHDLTYAGEQVGCADLALRIKEIRPRLHVFGHIHEGYGMSTVDGITYANACSCDLDYRPVNAPLVVDWSV